MILAPTLFALRGCSYFAPAPVIPPLPSADEVESIAASVTWSPNENEKDVDFSVPEKYFDTVLRPFDTPRYYVHPPEKSLHHVATLHVRCRDGRVVDVRILWFGKNPALFAIQGIPCIRDGPYEPDDYDLYCDESMAFGALLRAIWADDEVEISELSHCLDNSAGRNSLDN